MIERGTIYNSSKQELINFWSQVELLEKRDGISMGSLSDEIWARVVSLTEQESEQRLSVVRGRLLDVIREKKAGEN